MRPKRVSLFILAGLMALYANNTRSDTSRDQRGSTRVEPTGGLLLLEDYETLLKDEDLDRFRRQVEARYPETSLARLSNSKSVQTRRAAILALRLIGSIRVNPTVAMALKDPDPLVRELAERALWSIWFRADSAENNASLAEVATLIGDGRLEEAVGLATKLIERAPGFAEAYNQRAIAEFMLGRYRESADDCNHALERNRFHIGALSGLAECQMRLNLPKDAIKTLRRASILQPHHESLRQLIAAVEENNP